MHMSWSCSQSCTNVQFMLVGIFIQKDFRLTTQSQCFSAFCLKLLRNPLHCGKSLTKTASPWWALSWTVSRPISLCDLFYAPWQFQHKIYLLKILHCNVLCLIYVSIPCFSTMSSLTFFLSSDGGKTLTFFNHDYKGEFQTVAFEGPEIKKIFYGSFHKVSLPFNLGPGYKSHYKIYTVICVTFVGFSCQEKEDFRSFELNSQKLMFIHAKDHAMCQLTEWTL